MPGWLKRTVIVVGVLALGAGLLAAHIVYWYQPRVRPAVPRPGTPVAALLASDRFPAALWLPYPHQNLGMLMGDDEGYAAYLEACARLAGLPPLVLPSFGSFPVVPAREIALAADERGEHFVVMARVYPAVAAFARLAGRLAGNPWLGGGTVMVRDRPAIVSWDDGMWTVRDEDSRRVPMSEDVSPVNQLPAAIEPSLAMLVLHGDVDPFPAGQYRLVRVDRSIEIVSSARVPDATWQQAEAVAPDNLVLMMMSGARQRPPTPARVLAFFSHDRGSRDLPRAAAMNQVMVGDRRRWEVPGEDLARLAGALRQENRGVWHIQALGDASLTAAAAVVPRLVPVAGYSGPGRLGAGLDQRPIAETGPLAWGLWANVPATLREVERLADMLEDLPLIPSKERQRWRDAVTVLRPVADRFVDLTVGVSTEPPALRLRLAAQPAR